MFFLPLQICTIIEKNQFTKTVIDLGLLKESNILQSSIDDDDSFVMNHDYSTTKVKQNKGKFS